MVMVSFRDLLLFACFTFIVMVSVKGSFVVCLFYLYSYGVVQGIFLLVLSWWLWCRSKDHLLFACFTFIVMVSFKDLLLFVCFIFIVMVSFKGSFVVCLFYLDSYGVVQGIFCCLIVLPWWLWCRSRDLLLFVCFTFMVMVSFNGSFVVCLFYLYSYGVVQGIFCFLLVLPWWLWCRSRIFCCLLVLPL